MVWIFLGVGVVAVLAVAAAFVGSETFRLGHETPAAIFDLDEAVASVGDGLPEDAQGRVSFDEVRSLILATLEHLRAKGISALPGEDLRLQGEHDDVVVRDDEALAVVLGAVEAAELEVSDEDAALVIRGLLAHLGDIGALGPPA